MQVATCMISIENGTCWLHAAGCKARALCVDAVSYMGLKLLVIASGCIHHHHHHHDIHGHVTHSATLCAHAMQVDPYAWLSTIFGCQPGGRRACAAG
jgi:hypothetical protein